MTFFFWFVLFEHPVKIYINRLKKHLMMMNETIWFDLLVGENWSFQVLMFEKQKEFFFILIYRSFGWPTGGTRFFFVVVVFCVRFRMYWKRKNFIKMMNRWWIGGSEFVWLVEFCFVFERRKKKSRIWYYFCSIENWWREIVRWKVVKTLLI